VVILAHFHSLSSFIQGCGITPEIDFDKGHVYMDPGSFNTFRSVSEMIGGRDGSGGADGESGGLATASGVSSKSANSDNNASSSPSVSFAMDRPTPYFGSVSSSSHNMSNSASRMGTNSSDLTNKKQTKSILKKTEVVSSTTTANNTISSTASNVNNASPSNNTTNLLKDATHVNSLGSGGATSGSCAAQPVKKGLGSSVSEVEIIMATMKTLSETSPIEE
jgi:hypothetical protein